ncbi:DUF895 domain membrane protein [Saccharata proteae CBS 121410]|uniref:DUF895 domain membrane protein n=1 Tax=Saccharata proteae CBS 121410 TaxID=1314787 RepID=A0A6A5YDP2_9PEZI|nr:DUF895 domain membrane protein [Saccharata proteae CBS 121410]
MTDQKLSLNNSDVEVAETSPPAPTTRPKWYRSTLYNALILGLCNLLAPGIWGAMNSLGAGGEEKPYLVNASNALTFGLMVLMCGISPIIVRAVGIKATLIIGTLGYAPYAGGLYTNNRFGTEWFVILGAALCGLSAGLFWMAEAAVALAYPEPRNQGRFLGLWLSFRVGGQILGGAINLGLNATRSSEGAVSYNVYVIFIVLQALGPFAGLLINRPKKVQRTDGVPVTLAITGDPAAELKATAKLFFSRNFLLLVPLIAQAVYAEAVIFTFESLWFSVRARALGSFLSGIVAIIGGNILGAFLDRTNLALKTRARGAFAVVLGLQGVWKTQPVYDWADQGFGKGFALFVFWILGFQLNYLFLFFVVGNLAGSQEEVVRIAGLLRGTESAVQAVSYGLNSLNIMAQVGGVYLNFGLWAVSLVPGWLVIRKIGVSLGDRKLDREAKGRSQFESRSAEVSE